MPAVTRSYPCPDTSQCQSRQAVFHAPHRTPRVVITDKLRSYIKPIARLAPRADRRARKGLNSLIEGSHRPTRKREKIMGRFKSPSNCIYSPD